MDISSSAVTGAMKVGLQIVSSHKRPVLEVYHQVHNRYGPEREHCIDWGQDSKAPTFKSRVQNIFIQFTLVNIGGERAENVKLTISGDLKREKPRESFGPIFENIYPQMPAGHVIQLFQFQDSDLWLWEEDGNISRPIGMKDGKLIITMEYDLPKGFINWFKRLPARLRGKRTYKDIYEFSSYMVEGDLPPAEYM